MKMKKEYKELKTLKKLTIGQIIENNEDATSNFVFSFYEDLKEILKGKTNINSYTHYANELIKKTDELIDYAYDCVHYDEDDYINVLKTGWENIDTEFHIEFIIDYVDNPEEVGENYKNFFMDISKFILLHQEDLKELTKKCEDYESHIIFNDFKISIEDIEEIEQLELKKYDIYVAEVGDTFTTEISIEDLNNAIDNIDEFLIKAYYFEYVLGIIVSWYDIEKIEEN